ncbi:MAG: cyclic nucleotide-binding domain-containing protein [Pseudomonadota bacterium]
MSTESIASFKVFEGLGPEDLNQILSISEELTFQPDEMVFEESSLGANIYILLEGRVNVEMASPQSRTDRNDLTILRKGDVFGEIGFLEKRRRSAGVRAVDRIKVLSLDAQRLYDLFEQNSHTGYLVMRNLAAILAGRLVGQNFRWRQAS